MTSDEIIILLFFRLNDCINLHEIIERFVESKGLSVKIKWLVCIEHIWFYSSITLVNLIKIHYKLCNWIS